MSDRKGGKDRLGLYLMIILILLYTCIISSRIDIIKSDINDIKIHMRISE
jgi:hypothetical protein